MALPELVQPRVKRRCLALYHSSLLTQGIASLLRRDPEVEVTLLDMEQGNLGRTLLEMGPGVLLLDLNDLPRLDQVLGQLFLARSQIKVVCLDSRTSLVHAFQPETWELGSVAELLEHLKE